MTWEQMSTYKLPMILGIIFSALTTYAYVGEIPVQQVQGVLSDSGIASRCPLTLNSGNQGWDDQGIQMEKNSLTVVAPNSSRGPLSFSDLSKSGEFFESDCIRGPGEILCERQYQETRGRYLSYYYCLNEIMILKLNEADQVLGVTLQVIESYGKCDSWLERPPKTLMEYTCS